MGWAGHNVRRPPAVSRRSELWFAAWGFGRRSHDCRRSGAGASSPAAEAEWTSPVDPFYTAGLPVLDEDRPEITKVFASSPICTWSICCREPTARRKFLTSAIGALDCPIAGSLLNARRSLEARRDHRRICSKSYAKRRRGIQAPRYVEVGRLREGRPARRSRH